MFFFRYKFGQNATEVFGKLQLAYGERDSGCLKLFDMEKSQLKINYVTESFRSWETIKIQNFVRLGRRLRVKMIKRKSYTICTIFHEIFCWNNEKSVPKTNCTFQSLSGDKDVLDFGNNSKWSPWNFKWFKSKNKQFIDDLLVNLFNFFFSLLNIKNKQ